MGWINNIDYAWTAEIEGETIYYEPVCKLPDDYKDNSTAYDFNDYIVSLDDYILDGFDYYTGWC